MTAPESTADVSAFPMAPDVPMGLRERLKATREFHQGPERIRDAGGPVTMVRFGPGRIAPIFAIVTSPQGAHDVLAASDGAFDKEMIVHVQNRTFGDNLFNLPHQRWIPRRRTVQPVFTKRQVGTYAGHMAGAAETTATAMAAAGAVDLDSAMRRMTLQVLGQSVLGLNLGERAEEIGPPMLTMLQWNTNRAVRPFRAPLWLPTPARRRFRQALKAIHAVIDEAIDHAPQSGDAELIRLLQESVDPVTGRPISRNEIRDDLIAFIIAGHDTTATTLSYTLWALGRDPALQDRVAAEVGALGGRPLTIEDVSQLPLTVRVLHESLRLCPPAPAIGRLTMREVVVDGFRIPAGINVVVGAYALHRDATLWDDALRFDPDRFSPERSEGRSRWQYLPFGAGPRSCVGDHFAMLEATLGLATIVRATRIESIDDDFPLALPFTMTAGGPIRAQVSLRR